MRQALAGEFAALPGIEVLTIADQFSLYKPAPSVKVLPIGDRPFETFRTLAAEADYTLLVAPETGGILERWSREIGEGRSLGSEPAAIARVTDKLAFARHLESHGIPTPPTYRLTEAVVGDGSVVIKPIDGAGSVDTFVVEEGEDWPESVADRADLIVQPFIPGEPRSASVLVGRNGEVHWLAEGRMRIGCNEWGCVSYYGGELPADPPSDRQPILEAVASVPGLRGFVGVDFILSPEGRVVILEINPRPTTSVVGLTRLWPPGTIAAAWLGSLTGRKFEVATLEERRDDILVRFFRDGVRILPRTTS